MEKNKFDFNRLKLKSILLNIIYYTLLLCLLILAVYKTKQLVNFSDVFFVNLYNPIGKDEAERIIKENSSDQESFSMCFWEKDKYSLVKNIFTDRTVTARIISVVGRVDLIFGENYNFSGELSGNCVIDEETSFALFGNNKANNCKLSNQEQEMKVINVIKSPNKILVTELKETDNTYNLLAVKNKIKLGCNQIMPQLKAQYSIDGIVLNYSILSEVLSIFWIFSAVIVGIRIYKNMSILLKMSMESREKYKIFKIIIMIIICCVLIGVIKNMVVLSDEYLPTKWSDFEFWTQLYKVKKSDIINIFNYENFGVGKRCTELFIISFLSLILIDILIILKKINCKGCMQFFSRHLNCLHIKKRRKEHEKINNKKAT